MGYSLKVEAASEEFASEVEGKVQLTCPKAEKYRLKQQIQFLLPYEEMPMFSSLFKWLESELDILKFIQYQKPLQLFIQCIKSFTKKTS